MKTINVMRVILAHAYGVDFSDKSDAYVEGFFNRSCASGVHLDAAGNVIGDPDPDDLANRNARGETAAKPRRKLQPGGGYKGGEDDDEASDDQGEDAEQAAMNRARSRNATAWQNQPDTRDRLTSLARQRRSK